MFSLKCLGILHSFESIWYIPPNDTIHTIYSKIIIEYILQSRVEYEEYIMSYTVDGGMPCKGCTNRHEYQEKEYANGIKQDSI